VVIGIPVYTVLRERERYHVARFSEDAVNRDPDQQVTDTWQSNDKKRMVTIKVSPQRPVEEYLADPTIKLAAERDRDNKQKGLLVLAKDEDFGPGADSKGGSGMMPGTKGSSSTGNSAGLGQGLGGGSGKSTLTADNSEKKTSSEGNPFDAKSEKMTGGEAWTPAKDTGPDPDRIAPEEKSADKPATTEKGDSGKTETAEKADDKKADDKPAAADAEKKTADASSDKGASDKAAGDTAKADDDKAEAKSDGDKEKTADAGDTAKPEETDIKVLLAEVPAGTPCRKVDTELTVKSKKKSDEAQPTLNTSVVCKGGDGKWQPALQIAGNNS
jgi:hypothetical protein